MPRAVRPRDRGWPAGSQSRVGSARPKSTAVVDPRAFTTGLMRAAKMHGAVLRHDPSSTAGPVPVDPADVAPDKGAHARLEALCRNISPALAAAPIKARQACLRPVTEDGLPLIGAMPGVEGAYVATGHSVWGMLNAPATGEAMSELILDGAAPMLRCARDTQAHEGLRQRCWCGNRPEICFVSPKIPARLSDRSKYWLSPWQRSTELRE